ncbi:MAG: hypothetical protein QE271_10445 [Bacteriovoracaceae bacterium]|nr:hypothetical protein [Bacteriovoracaceae bacterium]
MKLFFPFAFIFFFSHADLTLAQISQSQNQCGLKLQGEFTDCKTSSISFNGDPIPEAISTTKIQFTRVSRPNAPDQLYLSKSIKIIAGEDTNIPGDEQTPNLSLEEVVNELPSVDVFQDPLFILNPDIPCTAESLNFIYQNNPQATLSYIMSHKKLEIIFANPSFKTTVTCYQF